LTLRPLSSNIPPPPSSSLFPYTTLFRSSSLTLFYGLQYSWQDTEQAMGRNVRRGMSSDLTVDHLFLVATNPHDARVFESLERKEDRKSTRLNSSHVSISYAVFCLKKKKH